MQTRLFEYGGLSVKLFKSEQYGWVTTTAELAKGVGYSVRQLRNLIESKNLLHKQSVVEDTDLGKKISLSHKCRPNQAFWTVEGMTFVAMYLNSETCDQFRNEVLKTIKTLEAQGFMSAEEVNRKIDALERMCAQQQVAMEQLTSAVARLTDTVIRQDRELEMHRQAEAHYASAASLTMHAAKKTKHLRVVS